MILALNLKNNLVDVNNYIKNLKKSNLKIIIIPSYLQIESFSNCNCVIGSQNVQESLNIFTGEISATMLQKMNVSYCLVGHSERRIGLNEDLHIINKKIKCLLDKDITPILCFGENEVLSQTDLFNFIKEQLNSKIILNNQSKIMIGYEPVFAIGSEKPCENKHIQCVINFIKSNYNFKAILYGGSVSDNNINTLLENDLDGFLVGRASLDTNKIDKIIKILEKVNNE